MPDLKTKSWIVLIILLAGLCIAGCGTPPASTGNALTVKDMLTDLKLLLEELAANNRPIPTKLAELDAYEPLRPSVYYGISNKEIMYQWGAKLDSAAGAAIMAYEKKVPQEGGWVLMQDGTLKEMTSSEFNAAAKAK